MLAGDLSRYHLDNFQLIERVGSVLSLCGATFIISTFLLSNTFHKPINRLVFYASLGNVMVNIATIISRAAVDSGNLNGPLCQFQATFIQIFLPADVFWTFAMALNVMLTFYFKFVAEDLRMLEPVYALACYGIPAIVGFVFLGVQTESKGHIYGDATLWCWISKEWDIFRIACFYGPVWLVILGTVSIYSYAGRDIYYKRQQLRQFSSNHAPAPELPPTLSAMHVYVTNESEITSTSSPANSIDGVKSPRTETYITAHGSESLPYEQHLDAYPSNFSTGRRSSNVSTVPITTAPASNVRYATMQANTAIWSYTKVAMLFFIAMMVTWIPSSANRVYSVVHPGEVSLTLEYFSAFVLPLQGFWNAVIYAVTSLQACRKVWMGLKDWHSFGAKRDVEEGVMELKGRS